MNTISHVVIANKINRDIENILGISINRYSFVYGSVRPDLRRGKFDTTHYKEEAKTYVYKMIEKVFEDYDENWNSREFYVRLGEVIHFITDFFTYPHNKNHYEGARKDHHMYEFRQVLILLNRRKVKKLKGIEASIPLLETLPEIFNYIDRLHVEYLASGPGEMTDCIFAYKVCNVLTTSIVALYMKRESLMEDAKDLTLDYGTI